MTNDNDTIKSPRPPSVIVRDAWAGTAVVKELSAFRNATTPPSPKTSAPLPGRPRPAPAPSGHTADGPVTA
jgi:hypothetical protein